MRHPAKIGGSFGMRAFSRLAVVLRRAIRGAMRGRKKSRARAYRDEVNRRMAGLETACRIVAECYADADRAPATTQRLQMSTPLPDPIRKAS